MTLKLGNRVRQTSTTTGTGSLTLIAPSSSFRTFAAEVGDGHTCPYLIDDGAGNWETGIGTIATAGPTLARTTVLANSLGTQALINFSAGTKTVSLELDKSLVASAGGVATINQNEETKIEVFNNSGGTGAYSSVKLNNGTSVGVAAMLGTAYTGAGLLQSNRFVFSSSAVVGVNGSTLLFGSGDVEKFRCTSGNFMVGTTTANPVSSNVNGFSYDITSSFLTVSRVAAVPVSINRSNDGAILEWYRAGVSVANVSISAAVVAYNTSSDPSQKENFQDAPDVGALIDATPVWSYDWKATSERQTAGFKAPELAATFGAHIPGLTSRNSEGRWSYDPSKLVPMMFREIKSLRARVAALEARPLAARGE